MKKITKTILLADAVFRYFDEVVGGISSEFAYYELVEETDKYMRNGNQTEFISYLDCIFGISKKDFIKITKNYNLKVKEMKEYLD